MKFWLDDVTLLYNNYLDFYPKYESSREEQLNAITRACLYFIIISIMFNIDEQFLYVPVIIIAFCIVIYKIHNQDSNKQVKEFNKIMKNRLQSINSAKVKVKENNHFIDSDDELESNNTIQTNELPTQEPLSMYSADEIVDFEKATCRKPTKDNPLMNLSLNDYNNGDISPACNVEDKSIKKQIKTSFNDKLFKNLDELWDLENSQRQFYTLPSTSVPNKQIEFANFLYKIPKTCKEDQENCLRYEDLRFKR